MTFCGDCARRARGMQVKLRLCVRLRNLRRSCASEARNAGEIALPAVLAGPSAEIARVEGAKGR